MNFQFEDLAAVSGDQWEIYGQRQTLEFPLLVWNNDSVSRECCGAEAIQWDAAAERQLSGLGSAEGFEF